MIEKGSFYLLILWIFLSWFSRNLSIVAMEALASSWTSDWMPVDVEILSGVVSDWHFLCFQHCSFFPNPPNFGLFVQYLHLPQSDLVHPGQEPHLFLFTPMYVQMEVWHKENEFYSVHPTYSKSYGFTGLLHLPSFCLYFTCYDKQTIEWHFQHITLFFFQARVDDPP